MAAETVEELLLKKMDEILEGQRAARAERIALKLILTSCVANYVVDRDDAPEWLDQCRGASMEGVRSCELERGERTTASQYVATFFDAFDDGLAQH